MGDVQEPKSVNTDFLMDRNELRNIQSPDGYSWSNTHGMYLPDDGWSVANAARILLHRPSTVGKWRREFIDKAITKSPVFSTLRNFSLSRAQEFYDTETKRITGRDIADWMWIAGTVMTGRPFISRPTEAEKKVVRGMTKLPAQGIDALILQLPEFFATAATAVAAVAAEAALYGAGAATEGITGRRVIAPTEKGLGGRVAEDTLWSAFAVAEGFASFFTALVHAPFTGDWQKPLDLWEEDPLTPTLFLLAMMGGVRAGGRAYKKFRGVDRKALAAEVGQLANSQLQALDKAMAGDPAAMKAPIFSPDKSPLLHKMWRDVREQLTRYKEKDYRGSGGSTPELLKSWTELSELGRRAARPVGDFAARAKRTFPDITGAEIAAVKNRLGALDPRLLEPKVRPGEAAVGVGVRHPARPMASLIESEMRAMERKPIGERAYSAEFNRKALGSYIEEIKKAGKEDVRAGTLAGLEVRNKLAKGYEQLLDMELRGYDKTQIAKARVAFNKMDNFLRNEGGLLPEQAGKELRGIDSVIRSVEKTGVVAEKPIAHPSQLELAKVQQPELTQMVNESIGVVQEARAGLPAEMSPGRGRGRVLGADLTKKVGPGAKTVFDLSLDELHQRLAPTRDPRLVRKRQGMVINTAHEVLQEVIRKNPDPTSLSVYGQGALSDALGLNRLPASDASTGWVGSLMKQTETRLKRTKKGSAKNVSLTELHELLKNEYEVRMTTEGLRAANALPKSEVFGKTLDERMAARRVLAQRHFDQNPPMPDAQIGLSIAPVKGQKGYVLDAMDVPAPTSKVVGAVEATALAPSSARGKVLGAMHEVVDAVGRSFDYDWGIKLSDKHLESLGWPRAQRKWLGERKRMFTAEIAQMPRTVHQHVRTPQLYLEGPKAKGIFQRILYWRDLAERARIQEGGLPLGVTPKEITARLSELGKAATTGVKQALGAHDAIMRDFARDMVRREIASPDILQRKAYFPHNVIFDRMHLTELGQQLMPGESLESWGSWGGVARKVRKVWRSHTRKAHGAKMPHEMNYDTVMRAYYTEYFGAKARHELMSEIIVKMADPTKMQPVFRGYAKDGSPKIRYRVEKDWKAWSPVGGELVEGRFAPMSLEKMMGDMFTNQLLGEHGKPHPPTVRKLVEAVASKTKYYALPEPAVRFLENFRTVHPKTVVDLARRAVGKWKQITLLGAGIPFHIVNFTGDLMNLYREDVGALKEVPQAARTVWQNLAKGKPGGEFVDIANKFGVWESGFAGAEVGKLMGDPHLAHLSKSRAVRLYHKGPGRLLRGLQKLSEIREAIPRHAMLRRKLKQGFPAPEAAKAARNFSVDYGRFTDFENRYARGLVFPFYAWYKGNAINWFKYTTKHPIKFLLKFGTPYMLADFWNNGPMAAVEKDNPPWIDFHINTPLKMPKLPGASKGRNVVLNFQTPVDDWGRMIKQAATLDSHLFTDLLTPGLKTWYEFESGKSLFTGQDVPRHRTLGTAVEALVPPTRYARTYQEAANQGVPWEWFLNRGPLGPGRLIKTPEVGKQKLMDMYRIDALDREYDVAMSQLYRDYERKKITKEEWNRLRAKATRKLHQDIKLVREKKTRYFGYVPGPQEPMSWIMSQIRSIFTDEERKKYKATGEVPE